MVCCLSCTECVGRSSHATGSSQVRLESVGRDDSQRLSLTQCACFLSQAGTAVAICRTHTPPRHHTLARVAAAVSTRVLPVGAPALEPTGGWIVAPHQCPVVARARRRRPRASDTPRTCQPDRPLGQTTTSRVSQYGACVCVVSTSDILVLCWLFIDLPRPMCACVLHCRLPAQSSSWIPAWTRWRAG